MLLEHRGRRPAIDPSAYVAPNATVSGDVSIGPGCRVLFGAVLTAEGGPVRLGRDVIVMENAVIRGTGPHPATIGDQVLIGPRAYLTGCRVGDRAFLATGATVFNGAEIGAGAVVRINGVVHIKTRIPADGLVPINWVAVGDPAEILPPDRHDEIWAVQGPLNFGATVFGVAEGPLGGGVMAEITRRYGRALERHRQDLEIGG